ncbi:hypothetical protein O7635_24685 [Asanoa sp. WMMD1127]|uniref:hypothetical protein n=1 Tax=Asanoa sp. WMMD1127 TaxID=3016107 RepID=UPI002415B1D2|nr:hypothetical protein [Asanoa sp. WMMD1127]MDG4825058.1 hypothetical protein [Asanoa sp. WMMD1127]
MTDHGTTPNLAELQRFADRLRGQLRDLSSQLPVLEALQQQPLPLLDTPRSQQRAREYAEICAAYYGQLTRLCDVYSAAITLTATFINYYRVVDEASRLQVMQAYERFDSATRHLKGRDT